MPVFEFFDRLEPDLTLNEIVKGRKRLRKLREALALTGRSTPKPPVTHMNRTVLLRRLTEFDARLGKITKGKSGTQETRKIIEFQLAPALIGGVIGSGVGSKLSGKKLNPKTGKWEDDEGNEVSPPVASSAAGAVAGAGAGYGASKLHSTIMRNYGGADAGATGAYKTAARNVATQAGEKVSSAIGPTATTATQDVYGVGKATAEDVLKKLKGAGTAALRKVFGANAPKRFIELESRIDAIVFGEKKKSLNRLIDFERKFESGSQVADSPWREPSGPGKEKIPGFVVSRLKEFAQGDGDKKSNRSKLLAGAYLGGLATPTALRLASKLRHAKPPLPTGPGSYMKSVSPEFHDFLNPGAKIPPDKVADFLMKLHKGKIKV